LKSLKITILDKFMNDKEKQQLRERILAEIESAIEQIIELKEMTQPIAPDAAIGRLSRMEAINNKSVNELLLSKTEVKLQKLEASLSFIDKDDYGLCRGCKQPIPLGRLMMLPESDKCVDCA
jgi:DnaK suppressor protein